MSTLKERINEYLANASTAKAMRQSEVALSEFEDKSYWKDRKKIDLQHEQESLKMLDKRFHH